MRSGSPHQDGTVPQIGTALDCVRVVKSCQNESANVDLGTTPIALNNAKPFCHLPPQLAWTLLSHPYQLA